MSEIFEIGKMFLIGGAMGGVLALWLKFNQNRENKKKKGE